MNTLYKGYFDHFFACCAALLVAAQVSTQPGPLRAPLKQAAKRKRGLLVNVFAVANT